MYAVVSAAGLALPALAFGLGGVVKAAQVDAGVFAVERSANARRVELLERPVVSIDRNALADQLYILLP